MKENDRIISKNGKDYEVLNVRPAHGNLEIVDCKAIKPDGTDRKAKNKSFLVIGGKVITEVNY